MTSDTRKLVLLIIDGFGISTSSQNNPIPFDSATNLQFLWNNYGHLPLSTAIKTNISEKARCFESENCYLNISLGYNPGQARLNLPEFSNNTQLQKIVSGVRDHRSALHIFFVLSRDAYQSSSKQLLELLRYCQRNQVFFLYLHIIVDDSFKDQTDLLSQFKQLEAKISVIGSGEIVSIVGQKFLISEQSLNESILGYYQRNSSHFVSGEQAIKSSKITEAAKLPHCTLKSPSTGAISNFDNVIFANHNNLLLGNFISSLNLSSSKPRFTSLFSLTDTGIDHVKPIFSSPEHMLEKLNRSSIKSRIIIPSGHQDYQRFWLNSGSDIEQRFYPDGDTDLHQHFFEKELKDFLRSDSKFLLIQYSELIKECQNTGFSGCVKSAQLVNLIIRVIFEQIMHFDASLYITSAFGMAENLSHSKEMSEFGFQCLPTASSVPFVMIENIKNKSANSSSLVQEIATSKHTLGSVHQHILKHFQIGEDL